MAKKINNILWDWSGVIHDNIKSLHFAVNYILKDCGQPELNFQEYQDNWEVPYMNFYKKYAPSLTPEKQGQLFQEATIAYGPTKPFPGMIEVVKNLKQNNKKMIVVSMDPIKFLAPQIKDWDLENIFLEIFADVIDKAEGLQQILDKYNFNPQETIFIGDTTHEIEVGKQFNLLTGATPWGSQSKNRLLEANPDYIFESPQDIEKIIIT